MNLRIVRWIDIYLGITLAYLIFCLKKISGRVHKSGAGGGYRNILLVKLWGVGNVIMILPAAKALKDRYPGAKIDFLTLTDNKGVSESADVFNRVYAIDIKNVSRFIMTTLKSFLALRKRSYDLIIDFEQFARFSALFCSLLAKKDVIGFDTRGQHRHFLYSNSIAYNNHIHITKSFYQLAELGGAGHREHIGAMPIICKQKDIYEMQTRLQELGICKEDILVVLHTGTSENFSLRRWPIGHFAALADRLIGHFNPSQKPPDSNPRDECISLSAREGASTFRPMGSTVKIIFTGLSSESVLAEKAIACMMNRNMAVNLSGKLDFNQFVSLIKLSDLVVSADTAPVHLASCLSVPVVGLYGPNTPYLYGPWGDRCIWFYKNLGCSPCITNYNAKISVCRHPDGRGACMSKISADEVFCGIKYNFFDQDAKFRLRKLGENEEIMALGKKYSG